MATPQELMAPMLKRRLYAVVNTLNEGHSLAPHLAAHLEWLIGMEAEGKVFASGPFTDADGAPAGGGLTILRAGSYEEAVAMAQSDPFVRAGARTPVVHRWTLMEGSIGITANLSRGTFGFS